MRIDNSCKDLNLLSVHAWGKYSCLGKDGQAHMNIKGGFGTFVSLLLKDIPDNYIKYGWDVKKIKNLGDSIEVINGENKILCKHLICTFSLGVLKNANIFDSNVLSPSVQESINCMGYGGMGKVILCFEEPWWGTCEGFQFIWNSGSSWKKWTR